MNAGLDLPYVRNEDEIGRQHGVINDRGGEHLYLQAPRMALAAVALELLLDRRRKRLRLAISPSTIGNVIASEIMTRAPNRRSVSAKIEETLLEFGQRGVSLSGRLPNLRGLLLP